MWNWLETPYKNSVERMGATLIVFLITNGLVVASIALVTLANLLMGHKEDLLCTPQEGLAMIVGFVVLTVPFTLIGLIPFWVAAAWATYSFPQNPQMRRSLQAVACIFVAAVAVVAQALFGAGPLDTVLYVPVSLISSAYYLKMAAPGNTGSSHLRATLYRSGLDLVSAIAGALVLSCLLLFILAIDPHANFCH